MAWSLKLMKNMLNKRKGCCFSHCCQLNLTEADVTNFYCLALKRFPGMSGSLWGTMAQSRTGALGCVFMSLSEMTDRKCTLFIYYCPCLDMITDDFRGLMY